MKYTTFVLVLYVLNSKINAEQILDLAGKWSVRSEDGKYKDLSATVPGGIYTDLMANNIIEDVFYGFNDNITKWVPRTNWTYYTTFTVEPDLLENSNINILFEGLDTFSIVLVNNVEVGRSENMFVRYIFDVKNVLKVGKNSIEVRFESPIEVSARIADEQSSKYKIPPDCYSSAYGECHVNMIRKMQASFSWDWGPSFPSVGIWKDVHIESYNSSVLRYVVVDVEDLSEDEKWNMYFNVYFANNFEGRVRGKIDFSINFIGCKITRVEDLDVSPNEHSEFLYNTQIPVTKTMAKTWWPNGFGDQPLYNVTVTFVDSNSREKSFISQKIGFRKIELIQDKIENGSTQGLTFYFKVNDVPIFMKGSNEIPINILPERGQNKTTIKRLLTDVRDSYMNMLRVWGGGVYESDYFYELADEYGILIWQDFMFACAMYPASAEFEQNVIEEVRHQVKRLKSHPSIALFAGNNENEGALRDNWYATAKKFEQYKKDYISLYIDTIGAEFNRITENRSIFLSSSPSNGLQTISEGYIAEKPGSSLYGDVHFYNYVLDSFNTCFYPVPRFASEYGYQSFPSMKTLLTATNNTSDLMRNSAFMNHRQHHPGGTVEMGLLMSYQLKVPNETNIRGYIYYAQIIQAMSIKIETEHYRVHRNFLDVVGQGYTMGALYWQLNDVWVAPTWSGIDFNGKWKMLQYFTKQFFAPIIITAMMDAARQLQIYTVCDKSLTDLNATAILFVYKYNSLTPVHNLSIAVGLEGGSSQLIQSFFVDDFLIKSGCNNSLLRNEARNNCFFYLKLMANDVEISPDNYFFPSQFKISNLQQPNLTIDSIKDVGEGSIFEIVTKTDVVGLFVWLDVWGIDGKFSENGFVQVEETRTIYFKSVNVVSLDNIKKNISITNLLDKENV